MVADFIRRRCGVRVHILYFFSETAALNHDILYMHISQGGLFNICENGGGRAPHTP